MTPPKTKTSGASAGTVMAARPIREVAEHASLTVAKVRDDGACIISTSPVDATVHEPSLDSAKRFMIDAGPVQDLGAEKQQVIL